MQPAFSCTCIGPITHTGCKCKSYDETKYLAFTDNPWTISTWGSATGQCTSLYRSRAIYLESVTIRYLLLLPQLVFLIWCDLEVMQWCTCLLSVYRCILRHSKCVLVNKIHLVTCQCMCEMLVLCDLPLAVVVVWLLPSYL